MRSKCNRCNKYITMKIIINKNNKKLFFIRYFHIEVTGLVYSFEMKKKDVIYL